MLSFFGSLEGALPLLSALAAGVPVDARGRAIFGSEQGGRLLAGKSRSFCDTLMGGDSRRDAATSTCQDSRENLGSEMFSGARALPAAEVVPGGCEGAGPAGSGL
eukprot:14559777-Alexandrium_andersonii.AAC.1